MARGKRKSNGATELGFNALLWRMANPWHRKIEAADYEHAGFGQVLGQYLLDAFEAKHVELADDVVPGTNSEDSEESPAAGIIWLRQTDSRILNRFDGGQQ